jgi:hypothetical protein
VRTDEAVAAVEDPNESIRHRAQQLELCPSTLWKILRNDLGLRAYKIQSTIEWRQRDVVSTRRRNMSHSARHNQFIEGNIRFA